MIRIGAKFMSVAVVWAIVGTLVAGATAARAVPTKLVLHSQIGAKVNIDESDFCVLAECKPAGAETSTAPEGFNLASGVAVAPDGNIYVVENLGQRVQELGPTGAFVLMFGREVNETKVDAVKAKGGTPSLKEVEEENVCTQVEIEGGAKCKAGVNSAEAGGFSEPRAITVDPATHNIYVSEAHNSRVDEYTESGRFLLMIGKEVNETKVDAVKGKGGTPYLTELEEENLCTQGDLEAGGQCQAGVRAAVGSTEHGAFNEDGRGSELAAGGPADLLYVGDEHRIQEFDAGNDPKAGTWVHDISLASISSAP